MMSNFVFKGVRKMSKYIVFQVGTEQYGLAIEKINSIEVFKPITWVPGSKAYFSGISSYRGELTPIVDIRNLLGIESDPNLTQTKLIFVYEGSEHVGLLVDEAKHILDISEEQISFMANVLGNSNSTYLRGIANLEDNIIGIINSDEIVNISKELVY
jgi:purine-binding chemotaxis protein CheW